MSYDKRLYEQAEQELNNRRLAAESRLEFNIAEAERKIPEIAEIRRQLSSTSIELSKLIIKRDGDFRRNFEKIKEQNLQGQAMIKQLLAYLDCLPPYPQGLGADLLHQRQRRNDF